MPACQRKPSVGGEALLEGVMMRGTDGTAIAIRKPDGGIYVEKQPLRTIAQRFSIARVPFIRGAVSMVESMVIGIKALMFSAEFIEIEEPADRNSSDPALNKGSTISEGWLWLSVALALIIGIGAFMVIPYFLSRLIKQLVTDTVVMNLIEGLIRVILFVGYIAAISRIKDIQRVFQYHGAEHKSIFCYEHDEPLTVENVRKYSTHHPRCGTAFLFIVMLISILVFSLIVSKLVWLNVLLRIVLIPVIMGVSYEVLKLAGRYDNLFMKIVSAPGMAMQHFTTQEPDDSQIEVAIVSLKHVLPEYAEALAAEEAAAAEASRLAAEEAAKTPEVMAEAEAIIAEAEKNATGSNAGGKDENL